jgi:hypothetical protein
MSSIAKRYIAHDSVLFQGNLYVTLEPVLATFKGYFHISYRSTLNGG